MPHKICAPVLGEWKGKITLCANNTSSSQRIIIIGTVATEFSRHWRVGSYDIVNYRQTSIVSGSTFTIFAQNTKTDWPSIVERRAHTIKQSTTRSGRRQYNIGCGRILKRQYRPGNCEQAKRLSMPLQILVSALLRESPPHRRNRRCHICGYLQYQARGGSINKRINSIKIDCTDTLFVIWRVHTCTCNVTQHYRTNSGSIISGHGNIGSIRRKYGYSRLTPWNIITSRVPHD